jgi:hypothetical protein
VARSGHEAVLLLDGRVLLTGGPDPASSSGGGRNDAELFDPATDTFAATGKLATARNLHRLARLDDGRVLVTGATAGQGVLLAAAEVFDPAAGGFASTSAMGGGRVLHTSTTLRDGRVLVAGGEWDGAVEGGPSEPTDHAELLRPDGGFAPVATTMVARRVGHTATLLESGAVLLVGGGDVGTEPGAELFIPAAR